LGRPRDFIEQSWTISGSKMYAMPQSWPTRAVGGERVV
jgi:hypothetical protein